MSASECPEPEKPLMSLDERSPTPSIDPLSPLATLLSKLQTTISLYGGNPTPLTPLLYQPMPEWFFPPLFSYDFDAADSPFLLLYPQRLPSEPHMDGGLFVDIYTLHGIWLPCPPGPAMPPSEKWLQLDYLLQKELSRWESGRYVQDPNAEERLRIQKWVPVPGPPSTATVSPTPPNLQVAEALLEWERLLSAIESKLPSSAPSERQREEPLRLEAMEGLYLSKFAKDFLGLSPRPKGWTFVAPGIRTVSEAGLREIYSVEAEDSFRRTVTAWEKGEDWVTLLLPSVKTVPVDVSHVSDRDISSFNDPYGFGMATVGRRAGLYTASADERDGDLVQLVCLSGRTKVVTFKGLCPWGPHRLPRLAEVLGHWAKLVEDGVWAVGEDGVEEDAEWFDSHVNLANLNWNDVSE